MTDYSNMSKQDLIELISIKNLELEALHSNAEIDSFLNSGFNEIFIKSNSMYIILDENIQITEVSRSALAKYGVIDKEQLLGQTPLIFSAKYQYDGKKSADKITELKNLLFESSKPIKIEWKHKDIDEQYWDGLIEITKFAHKNKKYYFLNVQDISEQKKHQTEREQSEAKLNVFFETMTQGVVFYDSLGIITEANPAARNILGITEEDINSTNLLEKDWHILKSDGSLLPVIEHPAMLALKTGMEQKDVVMGVYHFLSNKLKWILNSAVPLFKDDEQMPYQVYSSFTDITKEIEAVHQLAESEKSFFSLYSNMNEGVALHTFVFDENYIPIDYVIIDANTQYEKILGLNKWDIVGKNASKIYGLSKPPYLDLYAKAAMNGIPEKFETYFAPMDKYFDISVAPWGNSGFATIFSDVTDRKRAEKQLKEAQAKLIAAFENFPYNFWICDNEGRYTFQNCISIEMWGNSLGLNLQETHADQDAVNWFQDNYKKAFGGEIIKEETAYVTQDGEEFYYLTIIAPVWIDGAVNGLLGVNIDVTERKKAEILLSEINENLEIKVNERTAMLNDTLEELNQSNIELRILNEAVSGESQKLLELNEKLLNSETDLQNALQAKNKFFSIIAHDLKNPISSFIQLTELMNLYYSKMTPKEVNRILSNLEQAAKSTFDLLSNLLEWAQAQTGRIEFTPIKHEIEPIVSHMIKNSLLIAETKHIKIFNHVTEDIAAYFDREMIITVFRNIITNAVKFTSENGMIIVNAYNDKKYVYVSIKDTGIGMTTEVLDSLFRIDVKNTQPGTANEKGTGLGLLLCKEFVEINGGNIFVESELNKGSTFTFSLPINP